MCLCDTEGRARGSRLLIGLSRMKPQGGLGGADRAFITPVTGSSAGCRSAKQEGTYLSPRLDLRGPRQRSTCVTCHSELHYLSVYVQRESPEKVWLSHRTRRQEGIQSVSKAIHTPSVQGPPS